MTAFQISPKTESLYGLSRQGKQKRVYMEFLQLLQGFNLDTFPLKTLKLGWVAFQEHFS